MMLLHQSKPVLFFFASLVFFHSTTTLPFVVAAPLPSPVSTSPLHSVDSPSPLSALPRSLVPRFDSFDDHPQRTVILRRTSAPATFPTIPGLASIPSPSQKLGVTTNDVTSSSGTTSLDAKPSPIWKTSKPSPKTPFSSLETKSPVDPPDSDTNTATTGPTDEPKPAKGPSASLRAKLKSLLPTTTPNAKQEAPPGTSDAKTATTGPTDGLKPARGRSASLPAKLKSLITTTTPDAKQKAQPHTKTPTTSGPTKDTARSHVSSLSNRLRKVLTKQPEVEQPDAKQEAPPETTDPRLSAEGRNDMGIKKNPTTVMSMDDIVKSSKKSPVDLVSITLPNDEGSKEALSRALEKLASDPNVAKLKEKLDSLDAKGKDEDVQPKPPAADTHANAVGSSEEAALAKDVAPVVKPPASDPRKIPRPTKQPEAEIDSKRISVTTDITTLIPKDPTAEKEIAIHVPSNDALPGRKLSLQIEPPSERPLVPTPERKLPAKAPVEDPEEDKPEFHHPIK